MNSRGYLSGKAVGVAFEAPPGRRYRLTKLAPWITQLKRVFSRQLTRIFSEEEKVLLHSEAANVRLNTKGLEFVEGDLCGKAVGVAFEAPPGRRMLLLQVQHVCFHLLDHLLTGVPRS